MHQVIDHRLALDQLDHERLGRLAIGLARLTEVRHLAATPFRRTWTPPTTTVSPSST
jgi:hypothetical protein